MSRSPSDRERRSTRDIRLEDPGALRALAHSARLTIVDELYQGNERTASELAELTGLSPSAMSYHLRALERWGIVERGTARTDARERPWRAAGRTLTLFSDATSAAAADVLAGTSLQQLRDEFRRWSFVEGRESSGWREAAGISRSFLWLTEAEFEALAGELKTVVERYTAGRDAVDHAAGTRRVLCVRALVPEVPELPSG